MRSKNLIFVVLAFIGLNSAIIAQQKYAILIGGDPLATGVPTGHTWNNGIYPGVNGYDEIWNDTYLMWELLYLNEYGYSDENIHVFFKDGFDYTFNGQDPHYKSSDHNVDHITDMIAKKSNVMDLLITMQTTVTENDYLFIWIMSHGGNTTGGDSYIYLRDYVTGTNEILYDYELNQKLDLIHAMKKVVIVQAPNSGGFAEKLAANDVIVLTSSHKNEPTRRADDLPYTENETWGTNVYHHGEFGYHLYSPINGADPAGNTSYGDENFNEANNHQDDIISFDEAINYWLLDHHSTSEEPVYSDIGTNGSIMSVQFATLIIENITEDLHYRGIVGITAVPGQYYTQVIITNGSTYFLNAQVCFVENVRLVNDGGIINIEDNVIMKGNSGASGIISFTEINFTPGNLFTGKLDSKWGGVVAQGISIDIDNVTFQDCHLILDYIPNLEVSRSDFIRSGIKGNHMNGKITISENNFFTNSFCELYGNRNTILIIDDCNFTGPVINYDINKGININSISSYQITNCIVQGYQDGIRITNCLTIPDKDGIINNSIHNNSDAGIRLINSSAEIYNNPGIYENHIGIITSNYSQVKVIGNQLAQHVSETQRIFNNTVNQIYGTYNSFPYLRWNAIWSDYNTNCLVKWDLNNTDPGTKDISNNSWGPSNLFDPNVDFCPVTAFKWLPIWNLIYGPPGKGNDELLYDAAVSSSEQGNYVGAEIQYKQLVALFPESKFAETSLKQLLPLEKYLNNDYNSLKFYFQNDTTIGNHNYLNKVGGYLTAWCDIELEDFPSSIEYFENIIDNPPCFQDSIFAIIDLEYVYFLMENGLKSSYTGRYAEYKLKTKEEYEKNKDYLLSLIDGDVYPSQTIKQSINTLNSGELLQNVPNPFNGTTHIWFKLAEESSVTVIVYDYTGKEVSVINSGSLKSGNHSVEFNSANLPSGIYFFTLEVNGIKTDTKKMTLMR
jgi:hypothetical protein